VPVAITVAPPAATSAVMIPLGWPVPVPVVNPEASSCALESRNSSATCEARSVSWSTSYEACTYACPRTQVIVGCASVGLSSETSADSASQLALTPADVTRAFWL
jgi:hypothetical protein